MRVIAFIEDFKKILLRQTSPQAFGLVEGEAEAATAGQRAALDSEFISNSPLSGRSLRRRPICA
jgi:hypothetical protein